MAKVEFNLGVVELKYGDSTKSNAQSSIFHFMDRPANDKMFKLK